MKYLPKLLTCLFLILPLHSTAQETPKPAADLPSVPPAVDSDPVSEQDPAAEQALREIGDTYVLRPGDVVSLAVYQEADLSKEATISKNGMASFQLIGAVEIGGISIKDAATKISELYGKDYLRNPEMTLTVSNFASASVSVIGQVRSPGSVAIPLGGKLDIGSALASVGGITDSANPSNIQLLRAKGNARLFSHEQIQGDLGGTLLNPGDRIVVHESPFARATYIVLGEVKKAGSFSLPKSGRLNLATALATSGGVTAYADPKKGVRLTKASGGTTAYSLASVNEGSAGKINIGSGDTIMIAKNPWAHKTVTMLGEVNRKGAITFPLDGRLEIMNAIAMAGGFSDIANPKKVKITRKGVDYRVNTEKLDERKEGTVWLQPGDIVTVLESFL